ncbi:MAG: helix-turn-helix domain-containing protein [Thermoleophilia bacterium]|nr:helix-turn-helix domain-containing protein [Thermoleophilia bacterium]
MFEIGNSLREARVRRGLDFAQAELATKIRGKYLRALEDEQFEMLPAETYVKGFLRTYAEYLGLDGQLYVDEYNSRFVIGDEQSEARARRSAARPQRRNRRIETNVVLVALAAIAILTVVVISAWKAAGGGDRVPTRSATPPAARHPRRVAPLLLVTALRGSTHLTARVASARGNIAFDGTIAKGDPARAIRGRRLWVQIDTPENLRIRVRGKLVHVPGRKPQVIIVTPTGWRPA